MDSFPRITSALKKSIFSGIAVSTRYLVRYCQAWWSWLHMVEDVIVIFKIHESILILKMSFLYPEKSILNLRNTYKFNTSHFVLAGYICWHQH